MLNNVRSRVSTTGSVVVAGTLSRVNISESRGRRVGQNEIHDSFRQIFGPGPSCDEQIVSGSRHCTDVALDNFMKSSNFSNMIEDVAKLSGVQEVIFKHIPITMFEKGRLLEEEANAKKKKNIMSSSNEGEEQVNEENCAEHAPSMEEMGWSMVGDDSRQVNSSSSSSSQADEEEEVGAVSRKEFEMLKDEKEDQVGVIDLF
jgi:hypothetical protein